MPRTLISDDGVVRVWRITDAAGIVVGQDVEAVPTPAMLNEATLLDRAAQALTVNRAFLDLASPTNAQTLAQVKALTRQVSALIRLQLRALDDIE